MLHEFNRVSIFSNFNFFCVKSQFLEFTWLVITSRVAANNIIPFKNVNLIGFTRTSFTRHSYKHNLISIDLAAKVCLFSQTLNKPKVLRDEIDQTVVVEMLMHENRKLRRQRLATTTGLDFDVSQI